MTSTNVKQKLQAGGVEFDINLTELKKVDLLTLVDGFISDNRHKETIHVYQALKELIQENKLKSISVKFHN